MAKLSDIGEEIDDAAEETFVLFSQTLPQNDLGITDSKRNEVCVEAGGHQYSIAQSTSLLRSNRAGGTTGAMMWKVTPLIAQWLASDECVLWSKGILNPSSVILELGCGVAGIIGMTLSSRVKSYVLSDQGYVLKLLRDNIAANKSQLKGPKNINKKRSVLFDNLHTISYDWEQDNAHNLRGFTAPGTGFDIIVICDCVYNTFLIQPLTQACIDICNIEVSHLPIILIAQQLRTDDVFEEWLAKFLQHFKVWRVADALLPSYLQSSSGYVVHMAMLRSA